MSVSSKTMLFFVTIIMISLLLEGVGAEMTANTGNLPKTVGVWTRPDSAWIVDSSNIFNYMNGAGELYLAYRFDHLEVYEYTADQQDDILVEVYVMNSSNDAFGLLSLDWGGDAVTFSSSPEFPANTTVAPPARALYGEGLLRMAAGSIYARILAYRETPESKEAVLALGQAIAANREPPAEPGLLKVLPQSIDSAWTLRNDRIGYFRSYLVLNSFYYLSHRNILNLDHSTEAITAPYEQITETETTERVQFLCVNYATSEQAQQALDLFHGTYLPEHQKEFETGVISTHSNVFKIEDGWVGYTLDKTCLFMVFESPNQESARMIMEQMSCDAIKKES